MVVAVWHAASGGRLTQEHGLPAEGLRVHVYRMRLLLLLLHHCEVLLVERGAAGGTGSASFRSVRLPYQVSTHSLEMAAVALLLL